MLKKLLLTMFAVQVTACSVYTNDASDRNNVRPKDLAREKELKFIKRGQCTFGRDTGCVEGQIVVSQLTVDGNEYFDAASIAAAMKGLVAVKDKDGKELAADSYELALAKPITNDNFAEGFEAYLKGDKARSVSVDKTGRFKFNYLDEGSYHMRIQKRFSATVVDKRAAPAATGETKAQPAPLAAKEVCVTIFADTPNFDLFAAEANYISIDQYKLRVTDEACRTGSEAEPVVL